MPVWLSEAGSDGLRGTSHSHSKYEAIYDLALHHSRENVGRLLTWSILSSETPEGRTLTNEGGWLY